MITLIRNQVISKMSSMKQSTKLDDSSLSDSGNVGRKKLTGDNDGMQAVKKAFLISESKHLC